MTDINNNRLLEIVLTEMAEVAGHLWQRGWAERNAGNISVNISEVIRQNIVETNLHKFVPLAESYPNLAGFYFLVTGTGRRMRDIAQHPTENIGIIKINESADGYWLISLQDAENEFVPTSELPTHLGIHQLIAKRRSNEKVVMHSHVTELIAITQSKAYRNREALNSLLMSMHPETIMFIPKGIGFVPYCLPGTEEIAANTIKELQQHDMAVWEKHGIFAIGKDVSETFDSIDILAKSAKIFLMCQAANIIPEGFTAEQLAELKKLGTNF